MDEDFALIEARADSLVTEHRELMQDLVRFRTKHHLTQEVVAERMGVSQPTVAAFERYDSNPKLSTIRRYALAVGARIEHSVVDDCAAHNTNFDAIVSPSFQSNWRSGSSSTVRWGKVCSGMPAMSTRDPIHV
jgi:DNA-binding XRE family transcriptional regulator